MASLVGQKIGNYRLLHLLGKGGFADVYLAKHLHLGTYAAVKILHTRLNKNSLQQFRAEAQTIAHLEHPHIIRVIDFGVESDIPFLIMNYAPGGSLRKRYPKGTQLSLDDIFVNIRPVAEALQYAHDRKVVHRDVKPENMLLGQRDEVVLSDFGIAIVSHSTQSMSLQHIAGTPHYMAPEQFAGKARAASDQYSLGVVVYEWLCGTCPFSGSNPFEIALKHKTELPPPMRLGNPKISPAVEEVILTALSKYPEERFVSVSEFVEALEDAGQRRRYTGIPIQVDDTPARGASSSIPRRSLSQGKRSPQQQDLSGTSDLEHFDAAVVDEDIEETFAEDVDEHSAIGDSQEIKSARAPLHTRQTFRKERSPDRRQSIPQSIPAQSTRTYYAGSRSETQGRQNPSWRKKVAFIAIGMLVVSALIMVPIFGNVIHNPSDLLTRFLGAHGSQPNTETPSANSTTNHQPFDPHKIVIMPSDTDHPVPPIFATSGYLLDADTGATLYAYHPFDHLPMLGTAALMTAILAVEHGNLDQNITVTDSMSRDISQLSADSSLFGVKAGETYTLRDLIYGLLSLSGNDAAIVIADSLEGSMQLFVAEMDQRAQQLGLYDTHFTEPYNLQAAGQYSSAHDLALLGKYSMSLSVLHSISGGNGYHIPQQGNHPERFIINENQFLWWYPGVDGGKTGYDGQTDYIQLMSVTRNHHHLIGVVMHTNNWWTDMRDLMNWGFDSFTWISPYDVDMQHPIPFDSLWNYFASDTKDATIPTADSGRYYIYTGFSISGLIKAYFDANGGLRAFGYPIHLPIVTTAMTSQEFENGTISCSLTTTQCMSNVQHLSITQRR